LSGSDAIEIVVAFTGGGGGGPGAAPMAEFELSAGGCTGGGAGALDEVGGGDAGVVRVGVGLGRGEGRGDVEGLGEVPTGRVGEGVEQMSPSGSMQSALAVVGPNLADPAGHSRAPRIAIAGMRKKARLTRCLVRRTLAIDRLWQGDRRIQPPLPLLCLPT
jgi:hypothetical protein